MKITRAKSEYLDGILGDAFSCLDQGFIRVVDYMGNDEAIVQAARMSYGMGTKADSSNEGLIRYLMRHRHTSPFEMCEIKLHVKLPIFVARQWIRHRTANVNEYSARYSILSREFFVPDGDTLAPQSKTNKQGRAGKYDHNDQEILRKVIQESCEASFDTYDALIDSTYELARETARMVLPMNTYTEWYWKTDLHNLLNFIRLRADSHAQYEIRVYADTLTTLVKQWVPLTANAFADYSQNALTFSHPELKVLRHLIFGTNSDFSHAVKHLPLREQEELAKKIEFISQNC